jgi:hypothetical protein
MYGTSVGAEKEPNALALFFIKPAIVACISLHAVTNSSADFNSGIILGEDEIK